MKTINLSIVLVICVLVPQIRGHGMMLDPPNRSSMWRFGYPVPPNYNDNQLYCGGAHQDEEVSYCGICGDGINEARPRSNENGGTYGLGIISRNYQPGGIVPVTVKLTANHWGSFKFSICNLDYNSEEESCFIPVPLEDGSPAYKVPNGNAGEFKMNLRLPSGITCKQCVIRWTYRGGNTWGTCDDGTQAQGCGKQETFRSCADVSVGYSKYTPNTRSYPKIQNRIDLVKKILKGYKTPQKQ